MFWVFSVHTEPYKHWRIDMLCQKETAWEDVWSAEQQQKQNSLASISRGSGIIENKLCCVAVLLQTKY